MTRTKKLWIHLNAWLIIPSKLTWPCFKKVLCDWPIPFHWPNTQPLRSESLKYWSCWDYFISYIKYSIWLFSTKYSIWSFSTYLFLKWGIVHVLLKVCIQCTLIIHLNNVNAYSIDSNTCIFIEFKPARLCLTQYSKKNI